MITYKIAGSPMQLIFINLDNMENIPCDPANTDYQTFKAQINDQTAQLEEADGTLMTSEQAIAYVATLP